MLNRDLILSLDEDGNGLDKCEFVVGLLVKLEMVDKGNAKSFSDLFDALDNDHSGKLSTVELNLMVDQWQKAYDDQTAEHAKQGGIASAMVDAVGVVGGAARRGSVMGVSRGVAAASTTVGADKFVKNLADGLTTAYTTVSSAANSTCEGASDLVRHGAATRLQRAHRRKVAPESRGRPPEPDGKAAAYYHSRVVDSASDEDAEQSTISRIDIPS